MIPDNASDRHRNRLRFRRGEDGADIFQPEFQLESGGLVFLIGNQSAIGPVDRGGEQSLRHDFEKAAGIDLVLAHKGGGFAQAFDHCDDEEVSCELHEVGFGRIFAQKESALAHGIEQRLEAFDGLFLSGGDDEEFRGRGGVRASENGSRDIGLSAPPREPP